MQWILYHYVIQHLNLKQQTSRAYVDQPHNYAFPLNEGAKALLHLDFGATQLASATLICLCNV